MAVGEGGAVGAQADLAAGGVGVVVADLLVGGVVINERIHVAGADGEEEAWPAELPPRFARAPIGLAEDRDAKPRRLEHPAQDRHREAGVVDVGVAGDEDDVDRIPAARIHVWRGETLRPHWERQTRGS
jgi:hypothetical protein